MRTKKSPPAASGATPSGASGGPGASARGGSSKAERAAARRGQIVRAMLEVVAERGFDGASVAEVARRAGLAPGLVHYYFADKVAIACALVEHLGELGAEREAAWVARAPEGGRAGAAVDAYLARGPEAAPAVVACWVALGAEAVRRPEVRSAYGRVLGEAASRLGALLCLDGVTAPAGARHAAAAVVAAIQGYFQLSVAVPALVPAGSAAGAVRAMLEGLRAAGAAPRRDEGGGAPPPRGEGRSGAPPPARARGAGGGARAAKGARAGGGPGGAR